MRIAVNGFGSIWTRRLGRDPESMTRCSRDAAFFNTTGVPVGDSIRARSRVYGVARFNGSSGFTPHNPARMLNRVFECAEPCTRNNGNQVLFERLAAEPGNPDFYLATVRSETTGWLDRGSESWKASGCFLISFSESDLSQEALLLMPRFGWVRGSGGVYVVEPDARNTSCAQLHRAGS